MSSISAMGLILLALFLFVVGYLNHKGNVRTKKWCKRVLVLWLVGMIAVLLGAVSPVEAGIGVAAGAWVMLFVFKPWRSD